MAGLELTKKHAYGSKINFDFDTQESYEAEKVEHMCKYIRKNGSEAFKADKVNYRMSNARWLRLTEVEIVNTLPKLEVRNKL